MLLKINKNVRTLERDNQIIFINRANGRWIKLPRDISDILCHSNKNNYDTETLYQLLHDDEDRELFKDLIYELRKMNFFEEDEKFIINSISYSITDRCNLRCTHCMVSAKSNSEKDYFDTYDIKSNLMKIIKVSPRNIVITGGEPMLRPDFIEISRFCRDNYDGKLTLMTNGTLINRDNVKILKDCYDSFDISIDGYNEKTCSVIRGKGVFDKILKAIHLLKENGVSKINTSMVMSATNSRYVEEYLKLNKDLGTKPMLRMLSIEGRAKDNEIDLLTDRSSKELKEVSKNKTGIKEFKACSCTAGYDQFVVEADGSIYPCNLFIGQEYLMGNIRDCKEFSDIYNDGSICMARCVEKFDPKNYEYCKNCDVSYFCWSCLYIINTLTKEQLKEKCKYRKKQLEKIWCS